MLSAHNCKLSSRTKLGIKTVKIKRRQSYYVNPKMTIWQRQFNGANMTVFRPWQKKNGDTVDCIVVSIQVQPRRVWVFGRVWKLFCIHKLCALSIKKIFCFVVEEWLGCSAASFDRVPRQDWTWASPGFHHSFCKYGVFTH